MANFTTLAGERAKKRTLPADDHDIDDNDADDHEGNPALQADTKKMVPPDQVDQAYNAKFRKQHSSKR